MKMPYAYTGTVTDNQDEDKMNRVKVSAQLEGESVSYWLPCLTAAAGDGTGFSALPDIGAQVLVLAFGKGRGEQVVVGSFWSDSCAPPETGENTDADLNADGKNSLTFLKSKSGIMLICDDTDGKEKLQLIGAGGGSRIDFDCENEAMNMESDKDIALGAKGNVTIQSEKEISLTAKKALSIKCDGLNVKSDKDATVEAGKDMTLKGSSIALN